MFLHRLIPLYLTVLASALAAPDVDFRMGNDAVTIKGKGVKEASGLASSHRNPKFLWLVNDSGSSPDLHLIDLEGQRHGKIKVGSAKNKDWEDLASFQVKGVPYLLIADVGDNDAKREHVTLYLVQEPKLPAAGKVLKDSIKVIRTTQLQFEDGPRDCESVAVDAVNRRIILISKRTKPPMVYEAPLKLQAGEEWLTAKKIGVTAVKPPRGTLPLPYIDQPTGLDISPDGRTAAVVTYYGVFVFGREPQERWETAFAKPPRVLQPHRLPQSEAVAFSTDGHSIRVTSEGANSPIISYHRPRP